MPSGSHDINVKFLALMGIVSAILIFSLIVATQAWFRYEFQQENQRKYVEVPFAELAELKESQLTALNADPHYADPEEKDRVVVPIDMAIHGVVQKYAKTLSKAQ